MMKGPREKLDSAMCEIARVRYSGTLLYLIKMAKHDNVHNVGLNDANDFIFIHRHYINKPSTFCKFRKI